MSKFTNQGIYIYIHTFRFRDLHMQTWFLKRILYGRHKQIQKHKAIQIMWSDTVTDTETYTELPRRIRKLKNKYSLGGQTQDQNHFIEFIYSYQIQTRIRKRKTLQICVSWYRTGNVYRKIFIARETVKET